MSKATYTDECGGVYSADGRTLVKCPNRRWYRVAEGTTHLDPRAFSDCSILKEVELPWTLDEDVNYRENDISDEKYYEKYINSPILLSDVDDLDAARSAEYDRAWHELFDGHRFIIPFTAAIVEWERPYAEEHLETHCSWHALEEGIKDEFGVYYSKDGRRALAAGKGFDEVTEYAVRPGTVTICDMAFYRIPDTHGWFHPLTVHLPDSVVRIDEDAFPYYYRREGNDFIFDDERANDACLRDDER